MYASFLFLLLLKSTFFAESAKSNEIENLKFSVNSEADTPFQSWKAPWMNGEANTNPFYFPLVHDVKQNNHNLKDYHLIKSSQDNQKLRMRGLISGNQVSPAVNYSLGKTNSPNSFGIYYINFTLGSDFQPFSGVVDTGSHLLWVPCECITCAKNSSFLPLNSPYDLDSSTTSEALSCSSDECELLSSEGIPNECANSGRCIYQITYLSGDSSIGNLISDTFNVQFTNLTKKRSKITFGCGRIQVGNFANGDLGLDGLIGMGRSKLSLNFQLASNGIIESEMSMCLGGYGGGHLILGKSSLPPMTYIPLNVDDNYPFYLIDLDEVYVGSSPAGMPAVNNSLIVDSGTTFTYLPPTVFQNIIDLMEETINVKFESLQNSSIYCTPFTQSNANQILSLSPTLTFQFGEKTWKFSYTNYYYFLYLDFGVVCLSLSPSDTNFPIIGELLMRDYYLHFDDVNDRFGFANVNCTTGEVLNSATSLSSPSPSPSSSTPPSASLSPLSPFPSPSPPLSSPSDSPLSNSPENSFDESSPSPPSPSPPLSSPSDSPLPNPPENSSDKSPPSPPSSLPPSLGPPPPPSPLGSFSSLVPSPNASGSSNQIHFGIKIWYAALFMLLGFLYLFQG